MIKDRETRIYNDECSSFLFISAIDTATISICKDTQYPSPESKTHLPESLASGIGIRKPSMRIAIAVPQPKFSPSEFSMKIFR